MSFFITGTDTDVGKTFFSVRLIQALRAAGVDAVGFKPVACGGWDDVDALAAAGGGRESREAICPVHLAMPAAPLTAARAEQKILDPAVFISAYRTLAARHEMVIVEGAGGWLVPITTTYDIADLAQDLALPVIVVVRNRLGALNHTRLTLESIRARGMTCVGLVLNHLGAPDDPAARTNRAALELLHGVPVICELEHAQAGLDLARLALPGIRPEPNGEG